MHTGIIIELFRPNYITNYKLEEILKAIEQYCEIGSEIDYIYDTIEEPNSYLALALWYQDLEIVVNEIKKLTSEIYSDVIDLDDYYCFKVLYRQGIDKELFEFIRKTIKEYSLIIQEELLNVANGIINGYEKNEYYYDAESFINNIYMMDLLLNNLYSDLEHKSIKKSDAELKMYLIDFIKLILKFKKYDNLGFNMRKFESFLHEEAITDSIENSTLNTYLDSLDMIEEAKKKDKKLLSLKKQIKRTRKS